MPSGIVQVCLIYLRRLIKMTDTKMFVEIASPKKAIKFYDHIDGGLSSELKEFILSLAFTNNLTAS